VHAEYIEAMQVTPGFFETLGVAPAIGCSFQSGNEHSGAGADVAILSDALWRRQFVADRHTENSSYLDPIGGTSCPLVDARVGPARTGLAVPHAGRVDDLVCRATGGGGQERCAIH
jgi:hypothetical protein